MSELNTTLDEILQDKNTNLKPENLKAGVTCLGIEGSHDDPFYFEQNNTGINVRFGYILSAADVNNGDYTVTAQRATYNKYTYEQDGEEVVDETADIQFEVKNNNVNVSITNQSDGIIKFNIYNKAGELIYTRQKTEWSVPNKGETTWVELNDHIMQSTENMTREQLMQAYSFGVEIIYEPVPIYRYTPNAKLGSQLDNAVEILSGEELTVKDDGSILLSETSFPLTEQHFQAGEWNELKDLTLTYIFKVPTEKVIYTDPGILQYAICRLDYNGRTLYWHTNMELNVYEYTPAQDEIVVFNLVFNGTAKTVTYYVNGVARYTAENEDSVYGQIKLNKGSHVSGEHPGIDQTVYGLAVDTTKAWTAEEVLTYYNGVISTPSL